MKKGQKIASAENPAAAAPAPSPCSPLHLRVADMLKREIQAGVLIDGQRLPAEREMAGNLGISVGTLRKALSELSSIGMLKRVQGSGNYVRKTADVDNIYALFRLELSTGGGIPSAHMLSIDQIAKPADLPMFGTSDSAFRFRRTRKLDDTLAAFEEIWLDDSYADAIDMSDIGDSLYHFYKTRLGFWIDKVEDRVSVSMLPTWAIPLTESTTAAAWGHVERLSRDQHGHLAEFSRTWFDPDKVRFVSRQ